MMEGERVTMSFFLAFFALHGGGEGRVGEKGGKERRLEGGLSSSTLPFFPHCYSSAPSTTATTGK